MNFIWKISSLSSLDQVISHILSSFFIYWSFLNLKKNNRHKGDLATTLYPSKIDRIPLIVKGKDHNLSNCPLIFPNWPSRVSGRAPAFHHLHRIPLTINAKNHNLSQVFSTRWPNGEEQCLQPSLWVGGNWGILYHDQWVTIGRIWFTMEGKDHKLSYFQTIHMIPLTLKVRIKNYPIV